MLSAAVTAKCGRGKSEHPSCPCKTLDGTRRRTDFVPQANMIVTAKVAIPARTSGQYLRSSSMSRVHPSVSFPILRMIPSAYQAQHNALVWRGFAEKWQRGVNALRKILCALSKARMHRSRGGEVFVPGFRPPRFSLLRSPVFNQRQGWSARNLMPHRTIRVALPAARA